ncbi:MAG TPA: hypothetical protein VJ302_31535 [Blastocatellia bacterium]|nr:hypothetical protein [Blastocatellia bacterium]
MALHHQPIACVIRQYGTGLYRTCVSLERKSAICLSTHRDEESATETIEQFWEIYRKGEIRTVEDLRSLIETKNPRDLKGPESDDGQQDHSLALNE